MPPASIRARQPRARRWRWRSELLGLRLLSALLWCLGHRRALALGEGVGRSLAWLVPRRLRVAREDLRRVFGDALSDAEIDAIARRSLATLGGTMAELLWLCRAGRADVQDLVELDDDSRRQWMEAKSRGRGVILVGIHFGRWELMFLGANLGGQSFTVVTRPLDNPYVDDYLSRIRSRLGNAVLHVGKTRSMLARLASGETLLISMDHLNAKPGSAVFDFLGQPTRLTTGIARLALRQRATLLPIYALPGREGRLRIEIGPIVEFAPSGDSRRDVESITQQSADVLGAVIRRHPHYWMWSHKRLWRRRIGST